jgi:hypothetical protein
MSFQVAPDSVQAAAQNLANIHSTLEESSASVAAPTTAVAAAAEDDVSAGVAAYFSSFGQEYQVLSAQAQEFHAQFVDVLSSGAGAYLSTEVANAQQALASQVTAPVQGLLGAAAGAGSGAASAAASGISTVAPAAFPILGGLGGASVGSLLGGFRGATPVGSLLGGLGGGSVVSSLNSVFTALESGSAVSLLSGPIGTGLQTLSQDIAVLPGALQSLGGAVAPGLLHAGATTGSTGGPYQTLLENTIANLQTLGTGISANPAPFLHQILTNATGYANTVAGQLHYVLQNFPTVLANVPANIQAAIQGLLAFDPAPYVQQFINNQIAYAQIFATSLQNAGHSFLTGLQGLPAAFQSAYQALLAGNIGGALGDLTGGFLNLFATGVDTTSRGVLPGTLFADVTLTGSVAELSPIITIPGMMAQNFTNLLPAGSIAAQISQHVTNVIDTVTDTSVTGVVTLKLPTLFPPFRGEFSLTATAGLPTALALDALGAPVNALNAATAGASQFAGQLQTGNLAGAISTLVDGPAVVGNAFLNGQSTLPIAFDVSGYPTTINLPLDGLLVPVTPYTAKLSGLPLGASLTVPVGGTPLSGLATGLLVYAPEQLARAITP